jgi:hypothetical protein
VTDAEKALVEAALLITRQDVRINEAGKVSALLAARRAVIAERTPPEAIATCRELWLRAHQAERAAREYSRKLNSETADAIQLAAYEEVWPESK